MTGCIRPGTLRISCKHLVTLKINFSFTLPKLNFFLYFFLGFKTEAWKKLGNINIEKMCKLGRSKNDDHVLPVEQNLNVDQL